ncbi:hypothetical protein, partial [uncultured Nostoc sp.]|uniref:hypothetical protein n=1 Tax=uncultured Nostoc sp. TaxID=340711 RepID=UPI0035CBB00C
IKSFSCYYFASPKRISKNSWKTPEIRKHEIDLSGQKNVVGVVGWSGTISLDDERQQIGRPNRWSSF